MVEVEIIDFSKLEEVLKTARDLVTATGLVFNLIDHEHLQSTIQSEAYVNMIRLHNAAVDYIVSMKNIIKDKED